MYFLKLLGGASLAGDDGPVGGAVVQRHRIALLALLATHRQEGVSRDKLVAWLWPESDGERARNSLKQAVHVIRRALGADVLLTAGDELRLNAAVISSDIADFEEAVRRGDAERAVAIYSGDFLDGFFLSGAAGFEQWAELERARVRDAFGRCLEVLATSAEAKGELVDAAGWWRRLAAQDPGNARVALRLMHALTAAGDRAGAIRHAQVHAAFLREDLDVAPDTAVTALVDELRTAQAESATVAVPPQLAINSDAPPASSSDFPATKRDPPREAQRDAGSSRARRRSLLLSLTVVLMALAVIGIIAAPWPGGPGLENPALAVLPFIDLTDAADDAYFTDGMTEELIHTLSQVRSLRVTARTSAFQFKGRNVDVRDIGKDLGVGMVVEGSVRRSGDRVRITAQLVSTDDGAHLWSETYDRNLDDVLVVQEEIAQSIARELRLRLDGESSVARHSDDLEAYHLYLKGVHATNQRTPAAAWQAIDYFRQAIARDPAYALAYAGLAHAYAGLVDVTGAPPDSAFPPARAAALRALALDSTVAKAHALLGLMYTEEWQWDEASEAFARAFELDPDQPETLVWYSRYLDNMSRFSEALAVTLRAQELDPLSPTVSYNVAGSYLHLGRFEPAIAEARKLIELDPTLPLGYDALGWALVDAGRPAEAVPELEKAVALGGGRWLALANLGRAYAGVGRQADARAVLERLERDWGQLGYGNFAMAAVHLALGERETALRRLAQVYRLRHAKLPHTRQWTAFEPLYGDPDFRRIVRDAGFEPPTQSQ